MVRFSLTYNGTADLIIGLGSYSTKVAERAASLYLGGAAPKIVFTGGYGNFTDGTFKETEAETFRSVAISMGVPSAHIYCETRASNTGENILFSRELIKQEKLQPRSILFVSKPNMMRRCYATCKKLWPKIEAHFTSPYISFEQQAEKFHNVDSVINEIVGDILRISEYPKIGFQVHQDIPENVWNAFKSLVSEGFDKHLPHSLVV